MQNSALAGGLPEDAVVSQNLQHGCKRLGVLTQQDHCCVLSWKYCNNLAQNTLSYRSLLRSSTAEVAPKDYDCHCHLATRQPFNAPPLDQNLV